MPLLGQSSFRRLLLTRILLFSIPVLLFGMAVTFRRIHGNLLFAAQQNLTESAIRKADTIQASLQSLQTSLSLASQTDVLRRGDRPQVLQLFQQLQSQAPSIRCLQLIDIKTLAPLASTCGNRAIASPSDYAWPPQITPNNPYQVNTFRLNPNPPYRIPQNDRQIKLDLSISVPVYDNQGGLKYAISAYAILQQLESAQPWSLLGYTVVIDPEGNFLAHPLPNRIGQNINAEYDVSQFEVMLDAAQRGERGVLNLGDFAGDRKTWLAGYSPLNVSVTQSERQIWTVLAVTPEEAALKGLEAIAQILFILTAGLLAAHLLGMLYMARDLALPIEKLGRYARRLHKRELREGAPKDFRVRELNQLAEVLDNLVKRLEERAMELEAAWQEAETANQLKSEFLATTSHELRTPLNAIIGCIRLIKDGYCDDREEEMDLLKQADGAAVHLLNIINDLLDIQSIIKRRERYTPKYFDLTTVLREVIELQRVEIQRKNLEFNLPDLSKEYIVWADPERLRQVFLNVLSNAVKFTDEGGITIQTRLLKEPILHTPPTAETDSADQAIAPPSTSQTWIVVSFQDTGVGVPPDQIAKLFRPFVMADGSTTRKHEGTGLGLAISKQLVERMGGTIELYSEGINRGATVEIAFPLADPQQSPEEQQTESTELLNRV